MKFEKSVRVGPENGIHGRPMTAFVKTAKEFTSVIRVSNGKREVNGRSPMTLMGLAKRGEEISIKAEGDDAEEAVNTLGELISREDV